MITKPTDLPRWADGDIVNDPTSGQPNVENPTSSHSEKGYVYDEYPSRQFFNWLGRVVSKWTAWFNQQEQVHTDQISQLDTELTAVSNVAGQAAAQAEAGRVKNVEQDAELDSLDTRVTSVEAFVGTPIGTVVPYYGNAASLAVSTDSWLIIDGSVFDAIKFPKLKEHFIAIGKTDPTKLPEFAGQAIIGVGGHTDSSGSYNYAFGDAGGTAKHKLEISEMPEHDHGTGDNPQNPFPAGEGEGQASNSGDHSGRSGKTGGSGLHENRMPYTALYYIIKAK